MLPPWRAHPYLSRRDGILQAIFPLIRDLSTDDLFTFVRELRSEICYRFNLLETNTVPTPPLPASSESEENP